MMMRIAPSRIGSFQPLLGLGSGRIKGPLLNQRRPMLANISPSLNGLSFVGILQTLAEWLSVAFTTMGSIVDIPMGILKQGINITFDGLASVVGMIPVLGPLLSEIVLLGGAILAFAVMVPGMILNEFGNLLEGAAKWLDTKLPSDEKKEKIEEEKKKIIDKAPDDIKDTVASVLNAAGIGGTNTQGEVAALAANAGAVTGNTDIIDISDSGDGSLIPLDQEKSFIEKIAPVAAPAAAVGLLLAVILT